MADPFRFRTLHRVIGIFVLAAFMVVLVGIGLIGKARHWFERTMEVSLDVPVKDIGLLRPGLPVKLLGAPAGEVVAIDSEVISDGAGQWKRARLEVARSFHAALHADASAVIRTPVAGLLGESFIELVPGTSLAPLGNGVSIRARPQEDLLADARQAVANVADMAAQLRDLVSENRLIIQQSLLSLRQSLDRVENLAAQATAVIEENRSGVKTTVANAADASARVPAVIDDIGAAAQATGDAVRAAEAAAHAATRAADEITATVHENRAGLQLATDSLAPLLAKLDRVASEVGVITGEISSGEGTVGKLVMENTAHDRLVEVVDNLNQRVEELEPIISSITNARLFIGLDGGGNTTTSYLFGGVYIRVEPKPWKFYQGGISYRTAPKNRSTPAEGTSGLPVDFNFALGWRWIELSPRRYVISAAAGAVETRIGGWVDWSILGNDRATIRVLARDKWDDRDPDDRRYEEGKVLLRATAMLRLWRGIYVVGGGDDLIDAPAGWAGVCLELLDNDLRNITQAAGLVR